MVEEIDESPATDGDGIEYGYDAFIIVVDVFGQPDYRTLRRRCPGTAGYTVFLDDCFLADEAERTLLGSREIVIDSRGLARFLRTKRARWVKKVLIVVGLWSGEKTDAGRAVRWLEAQALTEPMMALIETCPQLQSVRVEVCLWSAARSKRISGVVPRTVLLRRDKQARVPRSRG